MKIVTKIITKPQITKRVQELAKAISKDFAGEDVRLICILKGGFIFAADLIRELHNVGYINTVVDFMEISSYGSNTESSRSPIIKKDIETSIEGKNVIIVEDIVDTGHSLKFLQNLLGKRKPKALKTCVMTSKPSRREVEVNVDYLGFEVEGWREGYGMDTDELGRGNPNIIRKDS